MPRLQPNSSHRLPAKLALAACTIAWVATAHAQIARLDDSASPRAQVQADFRQAQMIDAQTLLLPFGRVEYRLATAPYVGRRARIYYVIPLAVAGLRSPSGLQVQWRGALFQSGMGRPGDRVLVWNGEVRAPWITDTFDLQLRIDPRQLQLGRGGSLSFESYFEIEIQP
ncbi:hypothetical protein HNP33_000099 [Comamonas odontotermitis]|uniref:Uncharacterized protein n=1 Tax=Comamonas odontotermitis TaxID=379895 RepID=A0ABR6RA69_9BURK|nr:hypothetical protein [Comamonas odontotermitis]MBB6576051.1 hypothetical protein [Comamonas odontotermitis]